MADAKDVIRKTLRYRWRDGEEAGPGDELARAVAYKFAATYRAEDGSTERKSTEDGWALTRRIFNDVGAYEMMRLATLQQWRDRVREYLRG